MKVDKRLASGKAVIYLAACALHDRCPEREAVAEMELDKVYNQATRHSMLAITYIALSKYVSENESHGLDPEILTKWKIAHDKILQRLVMLDIERQDLVGFLEKNEIWHMEMKGVVMQNYYPRLGMRQMSDNDILIDPQKREMIKDRMLENGYEIVYYALEHPDTYKKFGTKFYFEMHHSLFFNIKRNQTEYDYYKNVKDTLVKVDGTDYAYKFTDEDFYIYLITHSYKHFTECGVGIRSLMDIYVYQKAKGDSLNREYIDAELSKLGIKNFESITSSIATVLFSEDFKPPSEIGNGLSDTEREMLEVHIFSGAFGTAEQSTKQLMKIMDSDKKITFGVRAKYFLRRLFPDMDYYKLNHPTVYKYKILIPFYWAWRIVRGIFRKPELNRRELKYIWKTK